MNGLLAGEVGRNDGAVLREGRGEGERECRAVDGHTFMSLRADKVVSPATEHMYATVNRTL